MPSPQTPAAHRVRVWDLPTRVFHWALVLCVVASVTTAYIGGAAMAWHFRSGYAIFSLLGFRLLWGFVGGRWSRFSSFVSTPATVWRYLRGRHRPEDWFEIGHTPLGALSVLAMLVLLTAQVASGLYADDEVSMMGPLAQFVSSSTSSLLTSYHAEIGAWLIIGVVGLHVAAIVYYRVIKRRLLIGPMLGGDKALAQAAPASADGLATRLLALALLLVCAAGVAWVASLGDSP